METILRLASAFVDDRLTLKPHFSAEAPRSRPLKIIHYETLESTNSTTYQLAEQSAPEWTVVIADAQTKGRGRGEKRWESPKGGLWFSILLRPNVVGSKLPILQFLMANATRQAIENETGLSVRLKWPNDLVLNSLKLGGVLIESKTQGDLVSFAIVGIGLNINLGRARLPPGAISLQLETGIRYDKKRLLNAVIDETKSRYKDLARPKPTRVLEEWWRNCVHRLARVQVAVDGTVVVGQTIAVGEDGSLLIKTDDDRFQRVIEGSLTLLND